MDFVGESINSSYRLSIKRNGLPSKVRRYHVVPRMGPNHNIGVYNNNVNTVQRALLERYFLCEVEGTFCRALNVRRGAFKHAGLVQFRSRVVELVKPHVRVLSVEEVVSLYRGSKRRVYERASASLSVRPIERRDAKLKAFGKFEKLLLSKATRIINPRDPRYNLKIGKYLKAAEKPYYHAINEVWGNRTSATVIKGYNVYDAGSILREKWDLFDRPVAIGLDAKKFDMHVSEVALKYEHSFYNDVFQTKELAKLLKWQLRNTGSAYCDDGVIKFSIEGTRCSGDLNTALGNCLLMCSMIYALVDSLGITAELANNGDDCVLFVEEEDVIAVLQSVPEFFRRLGFRMDVEEPVDVFEKIVFCQSNPIFDGDSWLMVRDVRTCLKKDPMCLVSVNNNKTWMKWLGAVGECGASLVSGIPILQEFYHAFYRAGVPSTDSFKQHVFRNTSMLERTSGLTMKWKEIHPEARASFCRAFGISPDYQIAVENHYKQLNISSLDDSTFCEGEVLHGTVPFLGHL